MPESRFSEILFEQSFAGAPNDFDVTDLYRQEYNRILATQSFFLGTVQSYAGDIEKNNTASDAYFSDSWPKDVKRMREMKGLPVGDVARYSPIVDFVSGQERMQRADEYVFSTSDDTNLTADLLNAWLRYRRRRSRIHFLQSQVFHNGITGNRCHVEIAAVPARDGTFKIDWFVRPYWEVYVQTPFMRVDAKDAPGMFHAQWVTKSWLKSFYDGYDIPFDQLDWGKHEMMPKHTTYRGDQYAQSAAAGEPPDIAYPDVFFDETKNLIRLIRYWQKRQKNIFQVLDPNPVSGTKKYVLRESKSKSEATRFAIQILIQGGADITGIEIGRDGKLERADMNAETRKVLRSIVRAYGKEYYSYHVVSGRVELEWEEDASDFLPWAHFFPYFVNGKYGGLFERVKDEAIFVNYMQNILIERMRRIGKMPIGIEEDALTIPFHEMIKRYESEGFITFKQGTLSRGAVREFQDRSLNSVSAYLGLVEHLQNSMERKIGADKVQQGIKPDSNSSGKAIQLLQESGSALTAPVYDNFHNFKKTCTEIEIATLASQYRINSIQTAIKVLKVVKGVIRERKTDPGMDNLKMMMQIGGNASLPEMGDEQGIAEMQLNKVMKILENIDNSEYTTEIDELQRSPSAKMQMLNMAIQISQMTGRPLPIQVAMSLTPMAEHLKDLWVSSEQETQAAMSAPGATNGMPGAGVENGTV